MDLDFWHYFGWKNLCLITEEIWYKSSRDPDLENWLGMEKPYIQLKKYCTTETVAIN